MPKIKITCDSTCDLSPELYEKYSIDVQPLGIVLGENAYLDGLDVTARDLFAYTEKTGTLPKTSAISIGSYEEVFRRYVEQGYEVIHINISSELSTCYQNACIAAEFVGNVYPIDSRSLSTGSGLLAIAAAELAAEGKDAASIVAQLNEMKQRLDVSFILQTLEYLHKGGRCSGVAAFGANLLKIRPEINVNDGVMTVGKKYRGSEESSILNYIHGRLDKYADQKIKRIFVTHSFIEDATLQAVLELVTSMQPQAEILVTVAGSTICSHCGPGCFGVLFFSEAEK